jgi:acyl-CoA thioester hydrolase
MIRTLAWDASPRESEAMAKREQTISIRVRYPEVDAMGYLHHSRYLQYFEIGRVELLRTIGHSYADLEKAGIFFAVVKVEVRYRSPARYDEEVSLMTRMTRQTGVRIDHVYELRRGETLLAEASSTIACVNRQGELQQIPDFLRVAD